MIICEYSILGCPGDVMPRDFVALPDGLDTDIRKHIAEKHRFRDVTDPQGWLLRGDELPFYRSTWLAYVTPVAMADVIGARMYFVVRVRQRSKRIARLEPLTNTPRAVERMNELFRLKLTPTNLLDYLNFYYAFTPKEDALLARLDKGGPTRIRAAPWHRGCKCRSHRSAFDRAVR